VEAAAGMNVLEVRNLSVRFGGLLAIESLDLAVREGEVLSLIGPNGAGKTTAFNAITGYLAPAAGEIVFLGKRINGRKASEIAALGLVRTFQKTSLFAGRSALENILTGLHLRSKQTPLAVMLGLRSGGARRACAGCRGGAHPGFCRVDEPIGGIRGRVALRRAAFAGDRHRARRAA
jgi:branched-chain amino acid transport system ATP-binding protein